MDQLLYLVLIIAVFVGLKLISLRVKYNKSQYKYISGNKFLKTILNKGNYGEFLTFCMLEKLGESKILTNIYLPLNDGTTEVDLLVVNCHGVFVFESKNYSGWIFGDEKNKMWTQTLKNGQKNKFFNPIWQNRAHISAIDAYLNKQYTNMFYSFIIFSERCRLKKITVTSKNISVINRNMLTKEFKNLIDNTPPKLTEEQVNNIYNKLKINTLLNEEFKERHIA